MSEFGDKFRKAREKRELSFDDVSNVTKISPRMLQAIEEEHFDQLPGGVFNRGFIRAYAKHLGMNSEDAVNDYLACLRQAQIDSHLGWDTPKQPDRHESQAPTPPVPRPFKPVAQPPVQVEELPELQLPRIQDVRPPKKEYLRGPSQEIPWLRIAAAVCLLIAALLLWTRHSRSIKAARATPASISAPAAQTPVTVAAAAPPQAAPSSSPLAPPLAVPAPVAQATTQTAQPTPRADAPKSTPAPAATPATTASTDPDAVKVQKKGDVTIRSFGATAAKPAEQSATRLTLVVRASENSWVSVTSDGQPLTQETLIAPAATSFHATREFVVRVGNAAGVSFLWNGEEIPPQGGEAEAKTLIFDAQGMHAAAPPPQN
ncbi:MAG TPA: RodZ domain-containing protein [Candidatus Sulfotelmatobacter sp.]|nr:RodZ domain-containing protein [Candidatus Sulfotelmatobacter sp.]